MSIKKKQPEWEPETVPCPFERDDFWQLWVKLLKMPKWKKKPLSAIEMSVVRLKRFDVDFAAMLVENAIEGNYQGVVFQDSMQKFEIWKINQVRNGKQGTGLRESVNQEFASRNYGGRGNRN